LGALSMAASVIATVLALRAARRERRLSAELQDLLEVRAAELEMFAERVAHDLKNPLGAISLRIAVAQSQGDSGARVADLNLIAGQLGRMNKIIDGLLMFARAGAAPHAGASADLGVALEGVVSDLQPIAKQANIDLSVEPGGSESVAV